MKKSSVLCAALLCGFWATAQIQTPAPSPASELTQAVGLSEVSVTYSRPSMRGRTIFGDLVPFDRVWRTGANANTTISFSDSVQVDGKGLSAGTYALFTKPGPANWEVYFYTATDNSGMQEWDESKVAASVTVPVAQMPMPVETFTITIDDLTNDGAVLGLIWENTYVGVPFAVPTAEKAMASIERVMGGPSANDYFAAASYYHDSGQDLAKARTWIEKAAEQMPDAYWVWRRKSLILADAGDKAGAIAAAKASLAAAEKAGNQDYVKMNKDSLAEWGAK